MFDCIHDLDGAVGQWLCEKQTPHRIIAVMLRALKELREVVALAEQGRLEIDTEAFPFNRTSDAYGRLERRSSRDVPS